MENWAEQNRRGRELALQAIEHMRLTGSPNYLGLVVKEMIERGRFTGVEVGFFHVIAELVL